MHGRIEFSGRRGRHWQRSLVAALFWGLGCAPTLELAPANSPPPTGSGPLRAGASSVDVTPPPGLSLFGYGPEGRVARGHRGRLRCRSLVLIDATNQILAWTVCDLAAISALLQRRAAELTLEATGIGADRLILSATHTHAGPAHYFEARAYSGPLSSEEPGFDPDVVDWLAQRIALGVSEAYARARGGGPARLAWQHGVSSLGLTRNRSIEAHCRNPVPMPGAASSCGAARDPTHEVDRRLSLLRVDRLGSRGAQPIAAFAVVAMHPTAIPNANEVYHADVFGVATRIAEARLGSGVVVAVANGIEGDVSPNTHERSWAETERLGRAMASDLLRVHAAAEPAGGWTLGRAYREVELPGGEVRPGGPRLCETAELGNPAGGGAEDGRTRLWAIPSVREGERDDQREGCHHPRRSWLAPATADDWSFPTFAPLYAVLIGDDVLVTLPGEMTTTPGLALRERLMRESRRDVVLVGLSGAYLQYFPSDAEFELQHYEGASALYGPESAAFLEERTSEIVGDLLSGAGAESNKVQPRRASPAPKVERLRRPSRDAARRELVRQPFRLPGGELRWAIEWASANGEFPAEGGPLVRVERREHGRWSLARDTDGAPFDDGQARLWVKQRRELRQRWIAVWEVPADTAPGAYRFDIGQTEPRIRSAWFEVVR